MTDNDVQFLLNLAIEKSSGQKLPSSHAQKKRALQKRKHLIMRGLGKTYNICEADTDAFLNKMNTFAESLTTIKHEKETNNECKIDNRTHSC